MSYFEIDYGQSTIQYELIYKERKSLGIKVHPDCTVKVLAPISTDPVLVKEKVLQKASWIRKQQSEFLSFFPLTPPRQYINGETHLYLGRQYRYRLLHGESVENESIQLSVKEPVKLLSGRLYVLFHDNKTPENLLEVWYREKAAYHFKRILDEVFQRFKIYDIQQPPLEIRKMKTRWGSCTSKGKITLNPELIKASKGCIEYVIIHELCHLVEHNHTTAFYNLQSKVLPTWKKWKEKLEKSMV